MIKGTRNAAPVVNLHFSLTPFTNESRVLRQTGSLVADGVVDRVHIVALRKDTSAAFERLDAKRDVTRIALVSARLGSNFAAHVARYVEFTCKSLMLARRDPPQVVTIHAVALLPLGVLVARLWRAKLVYDCHELETEASGLHGFRQRLSKIFERWGMPRADLVCVVSESIRDWYVREYRRTDLAIVRNFPPARSMRRTTRLREALGIPPSRRIVLYQGGLETGRGLEGAIAAFTEHDDGQHCLVLLGYGSLEPMARAAAERRNIIKFHPAVRPERLLEFTESADVGLCYIDDATLSGQYCLPNKLFEYVAAGLPVVVSPNPELRRFVETTGVGRVVESLSVPALFEALGSIAAAETEVRARVAAASADCTWEHEAEILLTRYRALQRA
jgi:glycosyltransferase involved in cell wall biosynthesis